MGARRLFRGPRGLLAPAVFLGCLPPSTLPAAGVPRPEHVVVVIEENHSYTQIIGEEDASYFNYLASTGALFTNAHAIEHPSQPNYLILFSGSNQGVNDDDCPYTFSTANLGSELIGAGFTFAGYSESLPSVGYDGCSSSRYVRKHSPWVNFTNIPETANLPFTSWPADFSTLPTLSFVIPNMKHNMHDGTIKQADAWLRDNLESYRRWAMDHNSLLIVTWDEDNKKSKNHIVTIFAGPMVRRGCVEERIDHFRLLRTLLDMYDLPVLGETASAEPITGVWIERVDGPDCNQNGALDALDLANGTSSDVNRNGIPDECDTHFHRGDPDTNGTTDLTDAVFLLSFLFFNPLGLNCLESADSDNDGKVDVADAVLVLEFLFQGHSAPAAPGPAGSACGVDPDPFGSHGDLGCAEYDACPVPSCDSVP